MFFDSGKGLVENISFLATTIGVFLLVASLYAVAKQIRMTRERNQLDRDHQAFLVSNGEWLRHLDHCYANIELDIYDFTHIELQRLLDELGWQRDLMEFKRTMISLSKLISSMEVAFVLYAQEDSPFRETQWKGWDDYIKGYFLRPDFYYLFKPLTTGFASDFLNYMARLQAQTPAPPQSQT